MTDRSGAAGKSEDPIYLGAHLQELLASDPRVHEPELDVTVIGTRIEVDGVVPTDERRLAVSTVLAEACPDHEVDNRTVVAADWWSRPRQERIS